jgi:hypothetical protein
LLEIVEVKESLEFVSTNNDLENFPTSVELNLHAVFVANVVGVLMRSYIYNIYNHNMSDGREII